MSRAASTPARSKFRQVRCLGKQADESQARALADEGYDPLEARDFATAADIA
jgi:hypothetical protein